MSILTRDVDVGSNNIDRDVLKSDLDVEMQVKQTQDQDRVEKELIALAEHTEHLLTTALGAKKFMNVNNVDMMQNKNQHADATDILSMSDE